MEIRFLGHSCFRIKTKDAVIVTDPVSPETGYKLNKVSADIVTVSHQHEDHNFLKIVTGTQQRPEPFVVDAPGEYEVAGVFIDGFLSYHDNQKGEKRGKNTIFRFEAEGVKVCHLGDLGSELDDGLVDEIDEVDVLLIPVGGGVTIDDQTAMKVINQIEPKIVIPMHFKTTQTKMEIAGVENFLKEIGVDNLPAVDKLLVSRDSLPQDRQVVLLAAKGDKAEE